MNNPKVLIFDIETAPMTAYIWALKDQFVGLNQLKTDWHVLAWGAKWLGTPPSQVMYRDVSCNKDLTYDKNILEPLWDLLDKADIVITQNGKSFDSPKLNARFIMHGMPPPSPYKHLDTYRIVKSTAQFTSNSLEYLTDKLCTKYKKLSHGKFPGLSLWKECLAGNKEAWKEMKRYNIHDVLSTEEFYLKIKAWAPQAMPKIYPEATPSKECNICGAKGRMVKQGIHRNKVTCYQRWKCQTCGSWSLGDKLK